MKRFAALLQLPFILLVSLLFCLLVGWWFYAVEYWHDVIWKEASS